MTTQELDENNEALRKFVTEIDCLDKLYAWTGKVNVFDILKISNNEIRHSNMLAWLLNPNENHGLGDWFFRNFILQLIKKNDSLDIIKLSTMNLYSFNVHREKSNIDLFLVSDDEKVVFTIENKIWSGEHDSQLEKYYDYTKEKYLEKGYIGVFVLLSPDGREAEKNSDKWCTLSYDDVVDALDGSEERRDFVKENAELRAKYLIDDYLEILRRDIVTDKELEKACNEIYNQHKKALDLIFKYKMDENSIVGDYIESVLNAYSNDKKIIYNNDKYKTYCCFYTEKMDKYLMDGENRAYQYYIRINSYDRTLSGHFELISNKNVSKSCEDNLKEIIKLRKSKNDKKLDLSSFTYKCVISSYSKEFKDKVKKRTYMNDDGVLEAEEDIKKVTEKLINYLLEQEEKLLNELNSPNIDQ